MSSSSPPTKFVHRNSQLHERRELQYQSHHSYVTANTDILRAAAAAGSITADRPVFTNSWLDVTDLAYYDATLNPYALTPEYVAYLTR
jgi:hypothetical protein